MWQVWNAKRHWVGVQSQGLAGPSPGFSSRGGHILKILYWMYGATRGPNVKWGAQISNGGAGHHWPPRWRRPWGLGVYGLACSSRNADKMPLTACQPWNHENTRPCMWDWASADVIVNSAGHAFQTCHVTTSTNQSCSVKIKVAQAVILPHEAK